MLGRAVGVDGEACLESEGRMILKRAAVDGGDNRRRVAASGRDRDRSKSTEQLITALMTTAVNGVHKAEGQAARGANGVDSPPVLPQPDRGRKRAVESHKETSLSLLV
jgi:hypothetical protein